LVSGGVSILVEQRHRQRALRPSGGGALPDAETLGKPVLAEAERL
jgi:hypothetical protein